MTCFFRHIHIEVYHKRVNGSRRDVQDDVTGLLQVKKMPYYFWTEGEAEYFFKLSKSNCKKEITESKQINKETVIYVNLAIQDLTKITA